MSVETVDFTEDLGLDPISGTAPVKGNRAATVREAAVLTTTYVDTAIVEVSRAKSACFEVAYDGVDYDSIEVGFEQSADGENWRGVRKVGAEVDGGELPASQHIESHVLDTYRDADTYGFAIPVSASVGANYLRAFLKRTGGTAVGTVSVRVIPGIGV